MRKTAVLFDLFGTIVPGFSSALYHENVYEMANILGVDPANFKEHWLKDTPNRGRGKYRDVPAVIHAYTGLSEDDPKVLKATDIRMEMTRRSLVPKKETLEVLSILKGGGIKLALVSNCSQETPSLFKKTEMAPFFDHLVFSSEIGVMKPDARIYLEALKGLDIKASDALFVGDGDCDELSGAENIGITPVLVDTGVQDAFKLSQARETCQHKIMDLRELLDYF